MKDLTKNCIYCAEEVKYNAIVCKHCKKDLPTDSDIENLKGKTTRNIIVVSLLVGLIIKLIFGSYIPMIIFYLIAAGSTIYAFNNLKDEDVHELIKINKGFSSFAKNIFIGFIILVLSMLIFNPTTEKLKAKLKDEKGSLNYKNIERMDWKICSFYVVDIYSINGKSEIKYVGFLNTFFEL